MFRPKKTIPTLVVGAMALFGCGDDSSGGVGGTSGTGGTGGSGGGAGTGGTGGMAGMGGSGGVGGAAAEALDAWCMKYVECYAQYTFEDCLYYNDSVLYYTDPMCFDELTSYLNCESMLSCAEFISDNNSCDPQEAAFFACTSL